MGNIQKRIKEYFLKKQAVRQAKIRREFLPEVLEIIEKPVSPSGHFVVIIITAAIVFLGMWCFLGKMDEVVTARGRIVNVAGIQNIQAVGTGIIEEICVVEGEHVVAGQPIVLVDSSVNELTLQSVTDELALLELENELLSQILVGNDITSLVDAEEDAEKVKVINYVAALYQEFLLQKEELASMVEQAELQVLTEEDVLEKLKINTDFLTEQKENLNLIVDYSNSEQHNADKLALEVQAKEKLLADYRELYTVGAIPKSEVEALELELAQLIEDYELQSELAVCEDYNNTMQKEEIENQLELALQDIDSQENELLIVTEQYEQAVERYNALEAEFIANISGLIVENENRINTLRTELEIQTISVAQQTIVSPVDGVVKTMDVNTVGGVLVTGQTVATIVPDDSQMIVEVDVLNQDIGCLQTGQTVVMKLDAFDFQTYGKLEGIITYISPDAIWDENKGWVYKIKISIDDAGFGADNQEIQIGVGMECTTEIKVGERKIIEFFMEPLVEHFDGSLEVR